MKIFGFQPTRPLQYLERARTYWLIDKNNPWNIWIIRRISCLLMIRELNLDVFFSSLLRRKSVNVGNNVIFSFARTNEKHCLIDSINLKNLTPPRTLERKKIFLLSLMIYLWARMSCNIFVELKNRDGLGTGNRMFLSIWLISFRFRMASEDSRKINPRVTFHFCWNIVVGKFYVFQHRNSPSS